MVTFKFDIAALSSGIATEFLASRSARSCASASHTEVWSCSKVWPSDPAAAVLTIPMLRAQERSIRERFLDRFMELLLNDRFGDEGFRYLHKLNLQLHASDARLAETLRRSFQIRFSCNNIFPLRETREYRLLPREGYSMA